MRKRPILKQEILKLLNNAKIKYGEALWYKKVQFYPMLEDWSPETVGRELRILAEKGYIEVGYYDGKYAKGLAKYRLKQ